MYWIWFGCGSSLWIWGFKIIELGGVLDIFRIVVQRHVVINRMWGCQGWGRVTGLLEVLDSPYWSILLQVAHVVVQGRYQRWVLAQTFLVADEAWLVLGLVMRHYHVEIGRVGVRAHGNELPYAGQRTLKEFVVPVYEHDVLEIIAELILNLTAHCHQSLPIVSYHIETLFS